MERVINKLKINRQTALILILCIVLNILGRLGAFFWELPVLLDFAGTFIAAMAGGPLIAAVVAVIPGFIMIFIDSVSMWYTVATALTALVLGLLVKNKTITASGRMFMPLGIFAALVYSVLSMPAKLITKEYAINGWQQNLILLLSEKFEIGDIASSFITELFFGLIDKTLCVLMAYITIYIMVKKSRKLKTRGFTAAFVLSFVLVLSGIGVFGTNNYWVTNDTMPVKYNLDRVPVVTDVQEYASENISNDAKNYKPVSHDKNNGYSNMVACCLEETSDGYIWIGGPQGLVRYDGNSFKKYEETGITEVTALFVDDSDRLWIGTADRGIALFSSDMIVYMDSESDFTDSPVTDIMQGSDGTIFACIGESVYKVTSDGNASFYTDTTAGMTDVEVLDGCFVGIKNGRVVACNNEGEIAFVEPRKDNISFTCLKVKSDEIYAGCDNGDIIRISFKDNKLAREEKYNNGSSEAVVRIKCEKSGCLTFISQDSFGILSESGSYTTRQIDDFAELTDIHEDYQGNIWVSSSVNGVCELAENKFVDVLAAAGIEERCANAILVEQGRYYIGTDTGLVIVDKDSNTQVSNAISKRLNGVKVTDIYRDTFNNLWFATHGSGLVEFETDQDFHTFSTDSGTGTSSINCVLETYDKSLVVGADNGTIIFFSNNKTMGTDYSVSSVLGEGGGLKASSILCIERDQTGKLYVGTDDNGLYVVKNKKIQAHYTTADGLTSDKVSKIVPHGSGYYLVTGAGLCKYYEGDIEPVSSFEYCNNYDLVIYKDNAYITGPEGLYKISVAELDSDDVKEAVLYGPDEGVDSDLTPYSWNIVDGSRLMLCTSTGVISYSTNQKDEENNINYYKLGLVGVKTDKGEINLDEDGIYRVPAGAGNLVFTPSVINFNNNEVKFKFFVERLNGQDKIFNLQQELVVDKLAYGQHRLWIQVLSDDEKYILQEAAYILEVDAFDYEKDWFIYCIITVAAWIAAYIICSIIISIIINRAKRMDRMMLRDIDDL